ncbi:MAG: hypothetical protein ACKVRP_03320 [Bacteroidota bacterium]
MSTKNIKIVDFIWGLFDDVDFFLLEAEKNETNLQSRQRYLRVSVLCAWAAFEGWINKTCYDFAITDKSLGICERAFLLEKRVLLDKGEFAVGNADKYESTEAKFEFLLRRFGRLKLDKSTTQWLRYETAKKLRDSIVHPKRDRTTELEIEVVKQAVDSMKSYINLMSKKIYDRKPLTLNA